MKIGYLGLGSNLGDRAANLIAAIERLDLNITRKSSIYETEPRDFPHQPWFMNQVIEVETDLFPKQLLGRAQLVYYPFYFPWWPLNSQVNRMGIIR